MNERVHQQQVFSQQDATADHELDFELIRLLARLDRLSAAMGPGTSMYDALRGVETTMREVTAYLISLEVSPFADPLARALSLAGRKHPNILLIDVEAGEADFMRAIEHLQRNSGSAVDRWHDYDDLCTGLGVALDRLFALIGLSFRSEDMIEGWEDMYATFLEELSHNLRAAKDVRD